eukprot:scaffold310838_cov50-Prasinocladus_malaysianus.AAC.1
MGPRWKSPEPKREERAARICPMGHALRFRGVCVPSHGYTGKQQKGVFGHINRPSHLYETSESRFCAAFSLSVAVT